MNALVGVADRLTRRAPQFRWPHPAVPYAAGVRRGYPTTTPERTP